MANIFLSYSREDQAAAKAIARLLEEAGHTVWWDRQIVSGHEFSGEIEAALDRADLVLVAWSRAAVRSPWVRDEAAIGRDSGRLLPVLLDAEQPPIGFRQFQTFDLSNWNRRGGRATVAELVAAIEARLASTMSDGSSPVRQHAAARPARFSTFDLRIAATATIVLAAVAAVLLFLSSGRAEAERPFVAVLPFSDLSPAHDKGFLAEGLAEEILSELGRNADIKVLGRTSSWALRERTSDPSKIRASLGVTHLLEGSVRAAGPDLRLSVRLIGTKDGAQQWTEEYQGRADDVFALQDRVAAAVAARLSATALTTASSKSHAQMTSADAYNLYLAARQIARTRTEPELRRAYTVTRQVLAAQPNFAPAHALMAELLQMLSDAPNSYGTIPVAKARPLARAHAQRAISLAPEAADGYAAMGLVGPPEQAIDNLRRAIKLDPARSELLLWLALELDDRDHFRQALDALRKAAAIDPLFPAVISRLAVDLTWSGRFDEAAQVIDQFEAQGGDPAQAARFRAASSAFAGDLSEVVRSGERALRLNRDVPYVAVYLRQAYWQMGLAAEASETPPSKTRLIRNAFFSAGYDAAIASAAGDSSDLWGRPDVDYYAFALAATRKWNALAGLFDARPMTIKQLCKAAGGTILPFATALQRVGRDADSRKLLNCLAARLESVQTAGPRHPYGIDKAQLLALTGKPDDAMTALNQAIAAGWHEPSVRLGDFPAFDPLAKRPDFAAAQARLDRWIARERQETLRLKGQG